ncbi:hypothetical protein CMV30_02915 [Nibricoccus aquaticus]|nr:hypothetical protein [Nibricoccus aquaticus]ATC62997.1 hypothetical protein CMV30_02915 [Nibricoccus aquaticus]
MSIVAGDFPEAIARFVAKKKEAVRHSRCSKKAHATFVATGEAMSRKKVVVRTSAFSSDSVSLIGAVSEAPIQALQTTRWSGAVFLTRLLRSTLSRFSNSLLRARQRASDQ